MQKELSDDPRGALWGWEVDRVTLGWESSQVHVQREGKVEKKQSMKTYAVALRCA
jgi:hypothetical protein